MLSAQLDKTQRDSVTFLNSRLRFRNAEGVDDFVDNADNFLADADRPIAIQAIERWVAASNSVGAP